MLREIGRWETCDVAYLADALGDLLRSRSVTPQPPTDEGPEQGHPVGGHVEVKTIRGHQYRYLRYWEGGRLRSRYLGKAETDE